MRLEQMQQAQWQSFPVGHGLHAGFAFTCFAVLTLMEQVAHHGREGVQQGACMRLQQVQQAQRQSLPLFPLAEDAGQSCEHLRHVQRIGTRQRGLQTLQRRAFSCILSLGDMQSKSAKVEGPQSMPACPVGIGACQQGLQALHMSASGKRCCTLSWAWQT